MEMNIADILKLPAIRAAIDQEQRQASSAEHKRRVEIIDEIEAVEADMAGLERDAKAATASMEKAHAAWVVERGKAGKVAQNAAQASRRYNTLLRDLRDYGERPVIDGELHINNTLAGLSTEIELLTGHLRSRRPEVHQKAEERLPELKAKLAKVERAAESIARLRRSRLSPWDLRVQVEELVRECE